MLGYIEKRRRLFMRLLVSGALITAAIGTGLILTRHTASAQGGGTVTVLLNEWNIIPDLGVVETGEITFVATNAGERTHELLVVQSAFPFDALPFGSDEERVDESQLNILARTARFGPGETVSITVSLAPGYYALICNLPDHYARGQRSSFLVTEIGVAPESLPATGSGGLADTGAGSVSPLMPAGIGAAAVVALSVAAFLAGRAAGLVRKG